MPTTVVARAKVGQRVHLEAYPTPTVGHPMIGGPHELLWHDPAYSFSNRFARQAARQAAEEARDPSMSKHAKVELSAEQRQGCTDHLRELVCDLPVTGVEHELRPHMVQFYQNTVFDSEPKYPHWHPHSTRSLEQKEDLHKCLNNPKKLKLIKPLLKPKPASDHPSPTGQAQRGGAGRDVYSPTSHSDAVSLMAGSRVGLETPLTSDHLVGLFHPEEFGPQDDSVRFDAFGGPTQQTLYGWTSPAGPKYVVPETVKKGIGKSA